MLMWERSEEKQSDAIQKKIDKKEIEMAFKYVLAFFLM
jgi:hypothetical protein